VKEIPTSKKSQLEEIQRTLEVSFSRRVAKISYSLALDEPTLDVHGMERRPMRIIVDVK
jgi:hypothetical protein